MVVTLMAAACDDAGGGGAGSPCNTSAMTCQGTNAAEECRAGLLHTIVCRGPVGCTSNVCDESIGGVPGEPCSQLQLGRTTCSIAAGRKVQCTGGTWIDLGQCAGCISTGADVVCASGPGPDAGTSTDAGSMMAPDAGGLPLSVTPAATTSPPRGTRTLSAQGGTGQYAWTMQSRGSGGTVSASGAYVAGTIGNTSDVVKVTDTAGATAFVSIAIGASLTISPQMPSVTASASLTFSATGGSGIGFTFGITTNVSGGTINAGTGGYVAGSTPGTDLIRVTDSLGNISSTPVAVSARIPRWTFLVYANADNDLEPFVLQDLQEMAAQGSSPDVNVLVEVDRHPAYTGAGVLNQPAFTQTKRFKVESGALTQLADLGETDMGAQAPLASFVEWGIRYAPAQRIALIFWDHGSGWKGFGLDATNGNSSLSLGEIRQGVTAGLAAAGRAKLDIIGFDACLMATWEVAYELRNLAEVLVASEDVEPGNGWDYTPIVEAMRNIVSLTPATLGQTIADSFRAHSLALVPVQAPFITLSVFDLTRMSVLVNAVNGLATALRGRLTNIQGWMDVARVRGETHSFQEGDNLLDLGDFAIRAKALLGASIAPQADAVTAALSAVITYKVGGAAQGRATGATTYFVPAISQYDPRYDALELLAASSWDEFTLDFRTLQNTDTQPPIVGTVTFNSGAFVAPVTGTDIDASSGQILVMQGTTGSRRVITMLPAVYSSSQVTQRWSGQVFNISSGGRSVIVPLLYGGQFTVNGTQSQQYLVKATFQDPTVTNFIPVVLQYVYDGTQLRFGGAFSTSGSTAQVTLTPGGSLRPIQLIEQAAALVEVEDIANTMTVTATAPVLGIELGVVGSYAVGFIIKDLAGNQAFNLGTFSLGCEADSQCRNSVGRVCNVGSATCVQCTSTNASACSGATPACEPTTSTCAQCTASNVSACPSNLPYCTANACAQCQYGYECSTATDVCVAGTCTNVIGRTIVVNMYSATVPATMVNGSSWDAFSGLPDPFVEIFANGVSLGRTASMPDTLSPVWNTVAQFTFATNSSLQFQAWDEDVTTNDYIEGVGWSTPSGVLSLVRAGGYSGTSTNGRVNWNIFAEAR